eukprot:TRINITY_DN32883_c0_g1_i1.p2 TRINITY_DN32883_c0_g1~~TRINITY_DN32883_c0_g1_i1.p2  ORF type:complete len:170 (-),score=2.77 TRINITY_DN32883_c0_g1_i1:311-820(-)
MHALVLNDSQNEQKCGERKRDVQKLVEPAEFVFLVDQFGWPDASHDRERNRAGEDSKQKNHAGSVAGIGAVNRMKNLRKDGAAETHITFKDSKNDASALGEVLDAGDEGSSVSEVLGGGAHADVQVKLPGFRGSQPVGDGQPGHKIAGKIHHSTDCENDPGGCHLVEQT